MNWQLSKQGIRWPVSLDRITGSGVDPSRSSIFFEVIPWQGTGFQMIACSTFFFFLKNSYKKYVVFMCRTIKIWFQTDLGRENSASCYRRGTQLLLTFLTMFTRWSHSTSNFYTLIGQNLHGTKNWIYTKFTQCKFRAKKCKLRLNKGERWQIPHLP